VYGAVPPEVVAVNVTATLGVIAAGNVKSVARARGLIVIVAVLEAVTAFASVTVTLTVKLPFTAYVCEAVAPAMPVMPSPKSQLKAYGDVPPEAVALTLTDVPTVPVDGTVGVTLRARGEIVTVADFVSVAGVGVAESAPVTLIVFDPFTL